MLDKFSMPVFLSGSLEFSGMCQIFNDVQFVEKFVQIVNWKSIFKVFIWLNPYELFLDCFRDRESLK